jgi:hypothetical protein
LTRSSPLEANPQSPSKSSLCNSTHATTSLPYAEKYKRQDASPI